MVFTIRKYMGIRILVVLAMYILVLLLLGMAQFPPKGTFSRQVGSLLVAGNYRFQESLNNYTLTGIQTVSFGGMEFRVTDSGFYIERLNGSRERLIPQTLTIDGQMVIFGLPDGSKLIFTENYTGSIPELTVSVVFSPETNALTLPYRPSRASRSQEGADGQIELISNGRRYRFNRVLCHTERRNLRISHDSPYLSYRVVPESEFPFDPRNFITPSGIDRVAFNRVLNRWREQNFSVWNSNIAESNNEDIVVSLSVEALNRNLYGSAVSSVSGAFLNGNNRTHESAVFLGRLDHALRSLASFEDEKTGRVEALLNIYSIMFLQESHIIEYLAVRGYFDKIQMAVESIQGIDPSNLPPALLAGILESNIDWLEYNELINRNISVENPFERLVAPVYLAVSQNIRRSTNGEFVFVFFNGENSTDLEYNMRLGRALMTYAESTGSTDWSAIGRSITASVLSLVDHNGTAPEIIHFSDSGNLIENSAVSRISSARLYRILNYGDNHPRAVNLSGGTWTWTAATDISASHYGDVLDIAVTFPIGETHYMLIRDVSSPSRLQLYDGDYRTSPDFERYNSSGWAYSAAERTLLIKMRHRSRVEHIRIFN